MPVSFSDLQFAFEYANAGHPGETEVYLDTRSGTLHYWAEHLGDEDELNKLPDDIEDERYIKVPRRQDLDLGRDLALEFAQDRMASRYDEVRAIFSHSGAYRQFRSLLGRTRMLEAWYDYSGKAEDAALRAWCEENGVKVGD